MTSRDIVVELAQTASRTGVVSIRIDRAAIWTGLPR